MARFLQFCSCNGDGSNNSYGDIGSFGGGGGWRMSRLQAELGGRDWHVKRAGGALLNY